MHCISVGEINQRNLKSVSLGIAYYLKEQLRCIHTYIQDFRLKWIYIHITYFNCLFPLHYRQKSREQ
jgi:hypothetical protein